MKKFETKDQVKAWCDAYTSKLLGQGMSILDAFNVSEEEINAAMIADGYDPASVDELNNGKANQFEERVIREGIVDTDAYRYTYDVVDGYDSETRRFVNAKRIKRIALDKLDTTDAIDGWEIVKTIID